MLAIAATPRGRTLILAEATTPYRHAALRAFRERQATFRALTAAPHPGPRPRRMQDPNRPNRPPSGSAGPRVACRGSDAAVDRPFRKFPVPARPEGARGPAPDRQPLADQRRSVRHRPEDARRGG